MSSETDSVPYAVEEAFGSPNFQYESNGVGSFVYTDDYELKVLTDYGNPSVQMFVLGDRVADIENPHSLRLSIEARENLQREGVLCD